MTRILSIIAFAGFTLSAVVHLGAVVGYNASQRFPAVWLLHVGIFVVFIPFVVSSRREQDSSRGVDPLITSLPSWATICGAALFSYAFINFLLFMGKTEGGNPSVQNGRFVLLSHGRLIREITASEYEALRTNEVRGFSGHWLVFYFLPFAYFVTRKTPTKALAPHGCE